jgi:hypothetical protein
VIDLALEVPAVIRLAIKNRAVITQVLVTAWAFKPISGSARIQHNLPLAVRTGDNRPFF